MTIHYDNNDDDKTLPITVVIKEFACLDQCNAMQRQNTGEGEIMIQPSGDGDDEI